MSAARDFVHDVARRIEPRPDSYLWVLRRARHRATRRRLTAAAVGVALTGALVAGVVVTLSRQEPRPAEPPQDPTAWQHVVVQAEGYVGDALSIAVDAGGSAHLVYGGDPHSEVGEETVVLDDGTRLPAMVHAVVEGGAINTSSLWDRAAGGGEASSIGIDVQGTTHVAWTNIDLFYTNDAGGSFAPPARIATMVHPGGMDMAIAQDGTPWIAFYGFEGMQVAHLEGDRWVIERIDRPKLANPVLTGIATWRDEVFVGYGSGRQTKLAHLRDGRWAIDTVDPDAGTAVDVAVDPDGEPTVAYVGADGIPRFAEPAKGEWEATELPVGTSNFTPPQVVIDEAGAHHFALYTASGVAYVTDAAGRLEVEDVPGSTDWPFAIDVSDGTVYVAWQRVSDAEGDVGDVEMATRTLEASPRAGA